MSTEITTDDADDAVDEVSAAADALAYDAPPPQPYAGHSAGPMTQAMLAGAPNAYAGSGDTALARCLGAPERDDGVVERRNVFVQRRGHRESDSSPGSAGRVCRRRKVGEHGAP